MAIKKKPVKKTERKIKAELKVSKMVKNVKAIVKIPDVVIGRPTDYSKDCDEQATKLALLGMNDEEIAKFFEVSIQTLNTWKHEHPLFLEALREGRDKADAEVAVSFRKRAMGYTYDEITFERIDNKVNLEISGRDFVVSDTYKKKIVTKEVPPDAGAALSWLKNRQKDKWRDKIETEHSGEVGLNKLSDEQIEALLDEKLKGKK